MVLKHSGTTRHIMNSEMLPGKKKTSWQTHKQTKPILAFSFPGTRVSEVKIHVAWTTSAITAAGSGRASSASVYLSLCCSDSPGPVWLGNRQRPLPGTTSKSSYALDLFYKTLMYINMDPGCLNSCKELSQDQHFEGKTELRGVSKWDAKCCLCIVHTVKTECNGSDYCVVFQQRL